MIQWLVRVGTFYAELFFLGVSMAVFKGIKVKLGDPKHTHRIHGAAIYGNMDPINIPPLC
jgi:hypothetical protein